MHCDPLKRNSPRVSARIERCKPETGLTKGESRARSVRALGAPARTGAGQVKSFSLFALFHPFDSQTNNMYGWEKQKKITKIITAVRDSTIDVASFCYSQRWESLTFQLSIFSDYKKIQLSNVTVIFYIKFYIGTFSKFVKYYFAQ